MVNASFEFEGNSGSLKIVTHFNDEYIINCTKHNDEIFRLGGTAVNEVAIYEGVILNLSLSTFRAFGPNNLLIEDQGILSPEQWQEDNLHCFIHEFYTLYMEGKRPGWFIASRPLQNAHHIFVNLDVLDGLGNVIKRYRTSPFTGEYRVITS